jgi:hypothetical protein
MHRGLSESAFTLLIGSGELPTGSPAYRLPEKEGVQGAKDFHRLLCFRQSGMAAIGKSCQS